MTGATLKSIAVAAALAVGAITLAPQDAHARNSAVPLIAGLAIGAIVAGTIARDNRSYARDRYYAPPPRYHYRKHQKKRTWHRGGHHRYGGHGYFK